MGKATLTHLDKLYWPDEKITKGDLIQYYESVSPYILPYLKNRPLSLKRNPNGIKGPTFFHKDAGENAPDWMHKEVVWSDSSNKDINYLIVDDKASLLYVANLGSIEMNPWHGHVGSLDEPDYLVIDLDPSEKNTFEQVIETAQAVKQVLDEAGAEAYCKTSGASGLHIYVPLHAQYSYEQCVAFAELIATQAQALVPEFTSLERSLKKRGPKIYIDYVQNRRSQTVACAYSVRPKPGATVSTPLGWEEVKKGLDVSAFNIHSILKRIEEKGDLFKGVSGKGINMAACLKRLGG
jgi:bifunctional non-homologous end joining protein LigD